MKFDSFQKLVFIITSIVTLYVFLFPPGLDGWIFGEIRYNQEIRFPIWIARIVAMLAVVVIAHILAGFLDSATPVNEHPKKPT